jgi:antirestriction protein ArdC
MAFDVYQAVTDRILEMLDKGTVPWRHPIRNAGGGWPRNIESDKPYRGVNVFLLSITSWLKGYGSSYWMTYRQAGENGGHVKRGEKSSMVVFWKQYETTDRQTGQPKKVPILRYYNVFNAEQCDGVKPPDAAVEPAEPFEPLAEAEKIIAGYADGPKIEHAGKKAYYLPANDLVRLAEPSRFLSREFYYATAFHELTHSTGHSSRLNRGLDIVPAPFGSPDYSREELIAEMGSAFLCATAGLCPPMIEQSAAYIAGWRKKLTADRKLIIAASGAGQRAADWILGHRLVHHHDARVYPFCEERFALY